jgi:broad specificity phosphatase PhoE
MKPEKIFIVRHGQSFGNVDKTIYKQIPDYAIQLTSFGRKQAKDVGIKLKNEIGNDSKIQFYVSPFWRTRQTYVGIRESFPDTKYKCVYYEDPRLREQEWGNRVDIDGFSEFDEKIEEYRDKYGHFYYRFKDGGESCADVFDRVSDFFNTLFRDFKKNNFPHNVIIVTHGMTMRLLIMRWFHCSVEEFESWSNPHNCEYLLLEKQESDKYKLVTPLRKHKIKHPYQFNFDPPELFPFPHTMPYEKKL